MYWNRLIIEWSKCMLNANIAGVFHVGSCNVVVSTQWTCGLMEAKCCCLIFRLFIL